MHLSLRCGRTGAHLPPLPGYIISLFLSVGPFGSPGTESPSGMTPLTGPPLLPTCWLITPSSPKMHHPLNCAALYLRQLIIRGRVLTLTALHRRMGVAGAPSFISMHITHTILLWDSTEALITIPNYPRQNSSFNLHWRKIVEIYKYLRIQKLFLIG